MRQGGYLRHVIDVSVMRDNATIIRSAPRRVLSPPSIRRSSSLHYFVTTTSRRNRPAATAAVTIFVTQTIRYADVARSISISTRYPILFNAAAMLWRSAYCAARRAASVSRSAPEMRDTPPPRVDEEVCVARYITQARMRYWMVGHADAIVFNTITTAIDHVRLAIYATAALLFCLSAVQIKCHHDAARRAAPTPRC